MLAVTPYRMVMSGSTCNIVSVLSASIASHYRQMYTGRLLWAGYPGKHSALALHA